MAPKSIDVQLIEALKNPDVIEALGKAIGSLIILTVEETVKNSLTEITKTLKDIASDNRALQLQTKKLADENDSLKKRLSSVEERIEFLDRESKQQNIIIRGLPETSYSERGSADGFQDSTTTKHESVGKTVSDMLSKELGIKISDDDMTTAFRMRAGPHDKVRPILVRFSTKQVRDSVMRSKKNLRVNNTPVYISEHLTRSTADLFASARTMVKQGKISASWTYNGQVFIKKTSDLNARPMLIKSANDLPR